MREPSYRRHKASGQAVVTIKKRDYYLGPYNSSESKAAYHRILAEYVAAPDSFGVAKQDATLAEVILAYVNHCKRFYGQSANSEFHRIKPILRAAKRLYSSLPASEFGPLQFKAVRQAFLDGSHRKPTEPKRKLSRRYVNAQMQRLRRMIRWAVGEQLIPSSVFEAIRAVEGIKRGKDPKAIEKKRIEPVSDEVVEKTLPHLSPIIRDLVQFQRLTGCRPSEALSVRPSMIGKQSEPVWEIELADHKTANRGKSRVLFIGPKLQAILRPHLEDCEPEDFIFSAKRAERIRRGQSRKTPLNQGNRSGKSNTPRKTSRRLGDQIKQGSYATAIRRVCEAHKIPHWTPYRLRHAKGKELQEQSDIETVRATLGHSTTKMADHYAQEDRKRARQAALEFG